MISILAKLLILIEDQPGIKKREILNFLPEDRKSVVYSGLARLRQKKLAITKPNGRFRSFKITPSGKNFIYKDLDWLKTINKKKGWFLLAFSVPETNKVVREQFRKSLQGIGMILIQRGLCIGKLIDSQPIEQLIKKYKVGDRTKIFKVVNPQLPEDEKNNTLTEELYQRFLDNSKSFLKYVKRFDDQHLRFRAKTLVYLLAQATKRDTGSSNLESTRSKSLHFYDKIREYCYMEN